MICQKCKKDNCQTGKLSIDYSLISGGYQVRLCLECVDNFLEIIKPFFEETSDKGF